MKEPGEIVKRYVEGLTLRREEKEEVENVILGYIADCTAKDKRIEELETFLLHLQKMILYGYVTLGDEKNNELRGLLSNEQ
jgi:hypothetical protein